MEYVLREKGGRVGRTADCCCQIEVSMHHSVPARVGAVSSLDDAWSVSLVRRRLEPGIALWV